MEEELVRYEKLDIIATVHEPTLRVSPIVVAVTKPNFGINSAAEIFKNAIRNCIQGIEGSTNISDDILIFGRNQEAHDKSLTAVFERRREKGLTLNKNKCVFNKSTLVLFGHIFNGNGVSLDPEKVQDIKRA